MNSFIDCKCGYYYSQSMAKIVEHSGKYHVEIRPLFAKINGTLDSKLWKLDVGFQPYELVGDIGKIRTADLVSFTVNDSEAVLEINEIRYPIGHMKRVRILPRSAPNCSFRVHHTGGVIIHYYNKATEYVHFRYHEFGNGYLMYDNGICFPVESTPSDITHIPNKFSNLTYSCAKKIADAVNSDIELGYYEVVSNHAASRS